MKFEEVQAFLGVGIVQQLAGIPKLSSVTELRLRVGKPLIIKLGTCEYGITNGRLMAVGHNSYVPSYKDILETMERVSRNSYYAYEAELAMGYITLPGGHRVGVAGQALIEDGVMRAWKYISAINIRIAHSVPGCANTVLPYIMCPHGGFLHTVVVAPPGCGKTTLLRDIVRQVSNTGITVGLVDERSEVAGCFQGVPQNDVGLRTDVLDGCPKPIAMQMLLRAMAPQVIAVDELGGERDARAVQDVLSAGVKLLCTMHGASFACAQKMGLTFFERYIVLGTGCKLLGVYDFTGECIRSLS